MVVVDTNVLVSAFLTPDGPCGTVFRWCAAHHEEWLATPTIIAEYERVLLRPCFGFKAATVQSLVALLNEIALDDVEPVGQSVPGASREDMQFYAVAVRYGARHLVTGNVKHYPTSCAQVKVVLPREYVTALET